MKKVLLLILAVVSVTQAYAQVDSLKFESPAITVDSLSVRLDKLQHDYNFLYCEYKIQKLITEMSDFEHSVDIAALRLLSNFYHTDYDSQLYSAALRQFNAFSTLLEVKKDNIKAVKFSVLSKILESDFSEKEQNALRTSVDYIDKCLSTAEASLSYLNIALQGYLSKKRF